MREAVIPEGWEEFEPNVGDRVWLVNHGGEPYPNLNEEPRYYVGPSKVTKYHSVIESERFGAIQVYGGIKFVRPVQTVDVTLTVNDAKHFANTSGYLDGTQRRLSRACREAIKNQGDRP